MLLLFLGGIARRFRRLVRHTLAQLLEGLLQLLDLLDHSVQLSFDVDLGRGGFS